MIVEAEMGISQHVLGPSHRGCLDRVTRDVSGYRVGGPRVLAVGIPAVQIKQM